ncbi:gamma-glutamyltransferase [Leptospira sp. GIMC2001]|uniref:gamma-glutamyltransferase n=1 Tax=Leptospira sp. GIMC2001 TaxID=1513297 RepID=UPI0023495C19|nr:gamma-glutamyltransferase [Leptospira sp. GIMC2001]WCL51135.1 gamma-glutamyltransferase [Leptospira sp. GIMC2001]
MFPTKMSTYRKLSVSSGKLFNCIMIVMLILACKSSNTAFAQTGNEFAIATDHPLASQAGKQIYNAGGNVIDAFVAASFAISVLRPQSTSLAGGGFALIHWEKSQVTKAFDFRERAPMRASRKMYLNADNSVKPQASLFGFGSVAVPGNVRGLLDIHEKYGRLTREQVLTPSLRLAEEGFTVYPDLAEAIEKSQEQMSDDMKSIFSNQGRLLKAGEVLVQKDLANTIRLIIQNGSQEFYELETSKKIIAAMRSGGGYITEEDLIRYKTIEREPIEVNYRDKKIISFPPPSSGVFLLEILSILNSQDLDQYKKENPIEFYRFFIEAMRQGYKDRSEYGGDPKFTNVPVDAILSSAYTADQFLQIKRIVLEKPKSNKKNTDQMPETLESYNTTHISVIDKEGNAVSSTQSLNYIFGSRVVAKGTGLVLNDTMDDFSVATGTPNAYGLVGGLANSIEPGKIPLSSMSPTIVLDDNKTWLVLGAPGGSFIPTAILNTLVNRIDFDMSYSDSVSSLRVHHQYKPDLVFAEEGLNKDLEPLEKYGYKMKFTPNRAKVFLVEKDRNGRLHAVSDPRGQGIPAVE